MQLHILYLIILTAGYILSNVSCRLLDKVIASFEDNKNENGKKPLTTQQKLRKLKISFGFGIPAMLAYGFCFAFSSFMAHNVLSAIFSIILFITVVGRGCMILYFTNEIKKGNYNLFSLDENLK